MGRSFSGGNNVQIAPEQALFTRAEGTTIAFWLRTTTTAGNTGIFSFWNGSSRNGPGILINNTANQVGMFFGGGLDGGVSCTSTGGAMNDGNWHHFAATFDMSGASNGCRVYKDGVFNNAGTINANWGQTANTYIVGAAADGFWNRYNGDLAEWGQWDIKLSDAQIAALGRGSPCGYVFPERLQLYLPFFE